MKSFREKDRDVMIFAGMFGFVLGMAISWRFLRKAYNLKYKEMIRLSDKHLEMFLVMDKWFENELKGKKLANHLRNSGIYNISIYGMGYIGKNLYAYLKKEGFEIGNLIDQNSNRKVDGIRIRAMDDEQAPTDAVIVTAVYYFEELENGLKMKFKEPIFSFADIVYKL